MSQIHAQAEAILNARPEVIYDAIADYKHGHPNIIPPESFSDLQVEEGGYGAGTVIRFKVKAFGTVLEMYQRVSEPEPGRVLVEQDIDSPRNAITTFTVIPVENKQQARVIIATVMNASPGLAGLVERLLIPRLNQRIYRKELHMLEAFAQKQGAAPSTSANDASAVRN
jgi:hypothetical protein